MSISGVLIALLAPILGGIADSAGRKRPWILFWSLLYVVGSFALWWAVPDASQGQILFVLVAFAHRRGGSRIRHRLHQLHPAHAR